MRIRFQADADLNQVILRGVKRQEPGIEFITPAEGGIADMDDPEVLAATAREGRVLVSHDKKTMVRHFYDFIALHDSAGVILIKQRCPYIIAIDDLLTIWSASESEEWFNRIEHLPL